MLGYRRAVVPSLSTPYPAFTGSRQGMLPSDLSVARERGVGLSGQQSADIRPVNSFDLTPVRMIIVGVEKWKITKGFVVSTCCYL